MTEEEILSIPNSEPERLFPNSEEDAKAVFRKLLLKWHPDVNKSKNSGKIVEHIRQLYDLVNSKIKNKTWAEPNTLVLKGADSKIRTIKYLRKRAFELGEVAYGKRVLCYIVDNSAKDLFGRGLETIKHSFVYKDDKLKKEIEKYLPVVLDNFETSDGKSVLVLAKTPDVFLLQDVIDFLGPIDPKHVAWIMSSLHNLACYMRTIGITHNAISTTTCFISPKFHSVLLYGGWWYSQTAGKNLVALPAHSKNNCPSDIFDKKIADPVLDLTLIKQVGLECLGDSTGMNLLHDDSFPKPFINFLRNSNNGNAFEEYKKWEKVRDKSFGERRFVEMTVKDSDIYKE